jgi:UDP-glucuronate 4-epimerase
MQKTKILVTGSAGFIGFHLSKTLISQGFSVVGIDNLNDYYDVDLKYGRLKKLGVNKDTLSSSSPNFLFYKQDILDKDALFGLFEQHQFTHICHLAAQAGVRYSITNPYSYIENNIIGFLNILEACKSYPVEHLCYASSSSVYGLNEEMPLSTEKPTDHPVSIYATSKKSNELMAHTYSHLFSIPTTALRFFTVYGPWGRPDMALFLFTKNILENKAIKVFNHGKSIRDFTYIDDIVSGIEKCLFKAPKIGLKGLINSSNSTAPWKVYNIGNSNAVKLMDFITAIENKLGIEAKKEFLPLQPGDVLETFADTMPLQQEFNYKPKTNITVGINNFIDWYLEYYKIN